MRWDAVCVFHVFPIFQNDFPCNNASLHEEGVKLRNEYQSIIQSHVLKHKGEYESVDAVLFGSSLLGFDFHLIYMNLCQKWTINKTTTADLRGI